jgi:hypothetical protein
VICGIAYIWYHLQKDIDTFRFIPVTSELYIHLFIVFLLMPLNWYLEILKWKSLNKYIFPLSVFDAAKGVLAGLSIGLFTPARTGEFAGKILYIKNRHRVKATLSSLTGSLAQLNITLIAGAIALPLLLLHTNFIQPDFYWLSAVSRGFGFLVVFVALLFYFYHLPFFQWLIQQRFFKRWKKYFLHYQPIRFKDLLKILLISLFRYIVFALQYVIMYKVVYSSLSPHIVVMVISVSFFIASFIPIYSVGEVITRGGIQVWLFSALSVSSVHVVWIGLLVWIINLVIPSLVGWYFILRAPDFTAINEL